VAVKALQHGGPEGETRTLGVDALEVAVLEQSRPRRAFRRIAGTRLEALLPGAGTGKSSGKGSSGSTK